MPVKLIWLTAEELARINTMDKLHELPNARLSSIAVTRDDWTKHLLPTLSVITASSGPTSKTSSSTGA